MNTGACAEALEPSAYVQSACGQLPTSWQLALHCLVPRAPAQSLRLHDCPSHSGAFPCSAASLSGTLGSGLQRVGGQVAEIMPLAHP